MEIGGLVLQFIGKPLKEIIPIHVEHVMATAVFNFLPVLLKSTVKKKFLDS